MEISLLTQARRGAAPATGLWRTSIAWLAALSAGTTFVAIIAQYFGTHAALNALGYALLSANGREILESVGLATALVLAFVAPRFGRNTFTNIERGFSQYAANRALAICVAGFFPVILRLSLLPALPIPQPHIADEFGHLLLADTFASGRITNPTHPMWRYFESLYVFHKPTYSSLYPIAQGLMLAGPKALGLHPWLGVLIGAGLMCAALCWMLQAWLPPQWALLGGLVAGVRFDVVTTWMNSYWGGAAAAIGGALLMGALPRLLRRTRIRDVVFAGAGLAILSQSRPFEGVLLSLPVAALLLYRLVWDRRFRSSAHGEQAAKSAIPHTVAPLAAVSLAVIAGGLYYNWRVTGQPLLLPYQLHQQIYGTPQNLLWKAPVATASRAAEFKDIRDNFEWQLGMFKDQTTWSGRGDALKTKLRSFWEFYLQPVLSVPLLLLPFVLRRDGIRFLLSTCLFVLLAECLLYPFFFPHYTALLCGPLLVLVLQGARYLRTIRWRGARVGDAIFRWCAVTGVISSTALVIGAVLSPGSVVKASTPRSRLEQELEHKGGKHLVLVRYTRRHSFQEPWIYNSADVDRSPVIWARELDEASMAPLLRYYADRHVWFVNADAQDPKLMPYEQRRAPRIYAIQNAAGKSPYVKKGVSPGSLVTLFGENFGADPARAEGCLISGGNPAEAARELKPAADTELKVPDLDGARPGVPVSVRREALPRLAIEQSALDFGATIEAAGEQSEAAPNQGLSIRFGDLPVQVLCVQQTEDGEAATVLAPEGLRGAFVDITVRVRGGEAVEKNVPVLAANPGILQAFVVEKTSGLLLRPDGTWVSPTNRARRGETLRMFATGVGPFHDAGPKYPLIVGVNDRGSPLEFVNCAECSNGILELGFQVPQDTPSGDHISLSLAVVIGGKPLYSNASTLAVQ